MTLMLKLWHTSQPAFDGTTLGHVKLIPKTHKKAARLDLCWLGVAGPGRAASWP